jgi:hypothetical protein
MRRGDQDVKSPPIRMRTWRQTAFKNLICRDQMFPRLVYR